MYTKLLASTALSLVIAGGAIAQDAVPADPMMEAPADSMAAPETPEEPLVNASDTGINADGWLATEIIGEEIYNSNADDAETIGEVNDFVLDQNGEIGAVVVGVGGFLGIGQKNVAINWDELELAEDAEGEQRLISSMTREQLENAAEFDRAEWLASESESMDGDAAMEPADPAADPMAPAAEPVEEDAAAEPMEGDAMAPADDAAAEPMEGEEAAEPMEGEAADPMADDAATEEDAAAEPMEGDAMAPADEAAAPAEGDDVAVEGDAETGLAWDTYEAVELEELTADNLTGTAVYGADDENVGDIGDIILSEDGNVDAVIIDFGGFLGIGTKPVAVSFDNLTFLRDDDGELLLRTDLTSEDLEAAPDYDENTYVENPEENTFIVE